MEETLETLQTYCVNYIIDALANLDEGKTFDSIYELANAMTQSDNVSGSFTYSTYKAQQYIKEWFNDLPDILEHIEFNYGEPLNVNPFIDSEKFHGNIVITKIEMLLNELECLKELNEITLTPKLVKTITKELETL